MKLFGHTFSDRSVSLKQMIAEIVHHHCVKEILSWIRLRIGNLFLNFTLPL